MKKKILKKKWQYVLGINEIIIYILMIISISNNIYYTFINEYILTILFIIDYYVLYKYGNILKEGGF